MAKFKQPSPRLSFFAASPKSMLILSAVFLLGASWIYAGEWLFQAFSHSFIGIFDQALRKLAGIYVAHGLIPYKDFGIVYPPGLAWWMGKLFSSDSLVEQQWMVSLSFLALNGLQLAILIPRFPSLRDKLLATGASLLLFTLILGGDESDPLSLCLLLFNFSLITLLSDEGVDRDPAEKNLPKPISSRIRWEGALAFSTFLLFLLRWDRPVTLLFFSGIGGLLLRSRRQFRIGLAQGIGILFGIFTLIAYAYFHRIGAELYEFVFRIPIEIIKDYRTLPLQIFWDPQIPDSIFSWAVGVGLSGFAYALFRSRRFSPADRSALALFALPLAMLPYALGRCDATHYKPFYVSVLGMLVLLGAPPRFAFPWFRFFCVLLLPGLSLIRPLKPIFPVNPQPLPFTQHVLSDCHKITQTSNVVPQSIFVGRLSYQHYLVNTALLYLTYPQLKPATAFISDEPGIQNSCEYGDQIVKQLRQAPRPLLAFLEMGDQPSEPNLTRSMTSCKKIESFLESTESLLLGECSLVDIPSNRFQVRIYR